MGPGASLKELRVDMWLSYSRIQKRTTCPRQDWFYYHERWRPRVESANLRFGSCLHKGLSEHFDTGEMPEDIFQREWEQYKGVELKYGARADWHSLMDLGTAMLSLFMAEHRHRIGTVYAIEQRFTMPITESLNLIGFIDLVADVMQDDGTWAVTVVDWKTASRSYTPVQISLSDQLTMYTLGSRVLRVRPERVAYCTMVKTKTPKIEWHFGQRGDQEVAELIAKANWAHDQILSGVNHRNPGQHCSWCDFAPICMGDEDMIAETLVQLEELPSEDDLKADVEVDN